MMNRFACACCLALTDVHLVAREDLIENFLTDFRCAPSNVAANKYAGTIGEVWLGISEHIHK